MNNKIRMPKDVKLIIDTLLDNGYEAYIVGGCVRDSLLGKEPKDWDITTNAKPLEIMKLFNKVILTGLKHGTITVVLNRQNYEITTYRIDGKYEDNRHPKEVEFVSSLMEDLSRRDFTVNSMAYNEKNGLIDCFNGIEDLNNKIIKTVGEPKKRFNEDALRMLRAIRFSAQLNFSIDEHTLSSIKALKDNIKNISKERIREEFNKILLNNSRKIEILKECELLDYIIPGIEKIYNSNQNNPYHICDLYNHTLLATEFVDSHLHLKLTMLLHDLGKVITKTIDENGISYYNNYQKESLRIAENVLKNLKYDNDTINRVLTLIRYHNCTLTTKISIKKMLNKIGENIFRDLIKIQKADILAQNPIYSRDRLLKLLGIEKNLNEIITKNECFSLQELKINGKDLIFLGFNKGKEIGETLNYILNVVIEKPELNEKNTLITLAKQRLEYLHSEFMK